MITEGKKIGVGFVGAAPDRGWALNAHVPALGTLPGFEIRAVSTTRLESAKASAEAFGAPRWYDDHRALAADPDVDLVVVTVKVPYHREIVLAAIEAGKAVFCEWPLGNGLDEAAAMADRARETGVPGYVGLQARCAPAVVYLRDLLAQGYVGDVLSTTLVGSGGSWGAQTDAPNAYVNDAKNGATMVTIPFGHTLDALSFALGEFRDLSSVTAIRREAVTVVGTGETIRKTAADQAAAVGTLKSGAVAAVHYRGGVSRGTNLLWEINGTAGDLQITGALGHAQLTELTLRGGKGDEKTLHDMPVPPEYRHAPADLPSLAVNVAELYRLIEADLRTGSRTAPSFDDAVVRHRFVATVEAAAANGGRIDVDRFGASKA